jgi:hypothetical protein
VESGDELVAVQAIPTCADVVEFQADTMRWLPPYVVGYIFGLTVGCILTLWIS